MRRIETARDWEEVAREVALLGAGKVLVLGASDVGKSSLCRFLCEALRARGHEVTWVDADIGQKRIGPSAAVTSADLGPGGPGATLDPIPTGFHFVGSTSPMGHFLPLVLGAARLVRQASGPFVVIDTTGLIHGPGRALKQAKLDAIGPDLIVAVEREQELSAILAGSLIPCLRVGAPAAARPKSDRERARARQVSFGRYFGGAERLTFSLEEVVLQNTLLFSGAPVALPGAVHAERTAEGLIAVADEQETAGIQAARNVRPGFERGLLCGLADAAGNGRGLGIVAAIDFPRRRIDILSPVSRELVAAVQVGRLHLTRDGRELGHASRAIP